MTRIIWIALLSSTLLISCSTFQDTSDNHKGRCNELKRRMIFNGQTGNQTLATQQRGELAKITQVYKKEGC